jgi:probable DNA metabolism protein
LRVPHNFAIYLALHQDCSSKILKDAEGLLAHDLDLATDQKLLRIRKMVYSVILELRRMKGFVRLRPLGDHVLYGYLKPRHDIGLMLCDHFARRNQGLIIALGNSSRSWISLCRGSEITHLSGRSLEETLKELSDRMEQSGEGSGVEGVWEVYYHSQYCPERRNLQAFCRRMPEKALRSAGLELEKNKNGATLDDFF